jgi:hypothetical protein
MLSAQCTDKVVNRVTGTLFKKYKTPLDFARAKPAVFEKEISSIFTRAKSEMVMALAVEHHLHITNLISLSQIAEMFSLFSSKYLITEFIPANDSKVQLLIKNRNKDLSAYTIEAYKIALEKYFNIIETTQLADSGRVLILLQKL